MLKETEGLDSLLTLVTAVPPPDDVMPTTGLQVEVDGVMLPATREVWRSWTGPRAVWGVPWHGPIYAMGSADDSRPWDGPRVCRCGTCQEHVTPDSRAN
jgi:hypothetical protein